MRPLRFIVAGLGARARTWLKVLRASADGVVVGLVDAAPAARSRACQICPGVPVGERIADVADQVEADAVILATPPQGRSGQIADACAAGLAILAEKPLADSLVEASAHVSAAESARVPLMVGLNFRYLPVTRALRDLLAQGRLGRAEFGRFTYERWRDGRLPHLNKYPLTMAQPMLWEQSVHHFDLMRFVYGVEPIRIAGRTFNPSWSLYADDANVAALIEFETGFVLNYQGTWAGNWARHGFEWRTDCTRGVAIQSDQFGALGYADRDDPELTAVDLPPHETWVDDARALLSAFAAHVRGEGPLECSAADHLKSLAMVEACILSSTTGQPINPADLPSAAEPDSRALLQAPTNRRR